jgi:hypothetical protein
MKPRRLTTICTLTAMLVCTTLSTGCDALRFFGPNLTIGFTIPLGLNGSPGILNPFGIVQALVNAALNQTTDAAAQQVSAPPQRNNLLSGIIASILN